MTLEESREVIPLMENMINQIEEQQGLMAEMYQEMEQRDGQLISFQEQNQRLQELNNELQEQIQILPSIEEMLELLEKKDGEIQTLKDENQQWNELAEKLNDESRLLQRQNEELLNSENKAENVQALKNELKQTKELLQSEKEKRKIADSTIEECQDKLRQAEREKEYALTHQRKVEIPVEKPVLYERCRNCDRKAYQQAKERYEHQRNGLEKKYKAKTVEFDAMLVVLWWYAIVTTIFAATQSEIFLSDFIAFVDTVWNGICQSGKWIIDVGNVLAQVGDRIPNETMAIVAHWLLFVIVIVGAVVAVGVLVVIVEKNVTKIYRENCRDVISVGVAVISAALVVYFGDWIKEFVKLNLVVILLLVQAVYVGIRMYVNGCKRARGYY